MSKFLSALLLLAAVLACSDACGVQKIANLEGNGYIVGGQTARPGSWPWQVQLLVFNRHYCGGTLIDKRWVLTAAHCVENYKNRPSAFNLGFGSHEKDNSRESNQVNMVPSKIFMHPSYSTRTLDYDIALFRLPQDVKYNNYIQPACVATSDPSSGTYCYTTGWGSTLGTGSNSRLRQAYVPMISRRTCNSNYYRNQITDRMVCAGYSAGGVDACQGDSGGPLVCKMSGRWTVVGATSWGDGCAKPGRPGVYASVANLNSWIRSTMANNS